MEIFEVTKCVPGSRTNVAWESAPGGFGLRFKRLTHLTSSLGVG